MNKSHQTEEWIKMLPSSSRDNAGPSNVDENVTMSKRKPMDPVKTQIGIYGWRKRCLFMLILVLILVVVFNLCLTLWFMEVLQFTSDGIGTLKVVKGGVMLSGKAYFMDTLIASAIRSRTGKPISLVTSQNFSVSVRSSDGQEMSNFLIKNDTVRFSSPSFNITGPRGETLFSANKNEIVFGTGEVRFTGHAGAVFDSSIQTPIIKGHYKRDLTIESITRMIEIFGPSGVVLDSRAGDITVSCLSDLKIESGVGAIKLDSSKVYLPRLPINAVREVATEKIKNVTVYQVCVCANGKLFLSLADGECATTDNETCHMGNLFAYYVATRLIDPVANRWQLHRRKKRYKKSRALTSFNFSTSRGGTDSTVSSSNNNRSLIDQSNSRDPQEENLDKMYVPYIELPTAKALAERRETLTEWIQRYRLFFPRDNVKMVIDGSYLPGGKVFEALKSCPSEEMDVEFRFMNLALFDGEWWNTFCAKVKRLKLYKCRMSSSVLYGIVMNGKRMISLRFIMPVISKCDLRAAVSSAEIVRKVRPALQSLTYCGSDADLFELFVTFLLTVYTQVVDFKIYLKFLPYSSSSDGSNDPLDGEFFSNLRVCHVISTRLMKSTNKIRSLDLRFFNGNPAEGCQIIPVLSTIYIPELIWLSKVSFYIHQEMDYEFFQALGSLKLLRSIKWSLIFNESCSFTYNCCIFSLTSFPKLRSLKIAYTKCFSLQIEVLDLLASSELEKFHLTADSIRIERGCENCSFLVPNGTVRELKIRINNFNLMSNQFYEVSRFMRILLRAFNKVKVLQYAPVKDNVMEDIIQYHPELEELTVELYNCSYSLFTRLPVQTAKGRIRDISDLQNLRHLTIIDVDGELDIGIFSFLNSKHIKSLKLFGRQSHERIDELVAKYFKKFSELDYFHCNSCLYVLDPFIQCLRKMFMEEVKNYFSDDYAEGDLLLIDSFQNSPRAWYKKLKDKVINL